MTSLTLLSKRDIRIVTLQKIQEFVDTGRLTAKADSMLTLKDLMICGLISNCGEGVKIVATVCFTLISGIEFMVKALCFVGYGDLSFSHSSGGDICQSTSH